MIITHIVTASSEIFFTKGSFWEECYSKFIGTLKNSTQFDTVLYSTSLKEPDIYNRLKTRKKTQNSRPLTKEYYISFPIKFYWFSLKPGLKFVLQEFWSKANSEREIQPKKKISEATDKCDWEKNCFFRIRSQFKSLPAFFLEIVEISKDFDRVLSPFTQLPLKKPFHLITQKS